MKVCIQCFKYIGGEILNEEELADDCEVCQLPAKCIIIEPTENKAEILHDLVESKEFVYEKPSEADINEALD